MIFEAIDDVTFKFFEKCLKFYNIEIMNLLFELSFYLKLLIDGAAV